MLNLLFKLLFSNAVSTRDKSILFSRVVIVSLLLASYKAGLINNLDTNLLVMIKLTVNIFVIVYPIYKIKNRPSLSNMIIYFLLALMQSCINILFIYVWVMPLELYAYYFLMNIFLLEINALTVNIMLNKACNVNNYVVKFGLLTLLTLPLCFLGHNFFYVLLPIFLNEIFHIKYNITCMSMRDEYKDPLAWHVFRNINSQAEIFVNTPPSLGENVRNLQVVAVEVLPKRVGEPEYCKVYYENTTSGAVMVGKPLPSAFVKQGIYLTSNLSVHSG